MCFFLVLKFRVGRILEKALFVRVGWVWEEEENFYRMFNIFY